MTKALIELIRDANREITPANRHAILELIEQQAARIAELEAARIAYASEFPPTADGEPDVGNIHANIRAMKRVACQVDGLSSRVCQYGTRSCTVDHGPTSAADTEALSLRAMYEDACIAASRNAVDATRYRFLREQPASTDPGRIDVVEWSEMDESANEGHGLRGEELDAAIDAALAQKQEGR